MLGYAIDVIAGSPLTALSLVGPNPAAGVRFFGIGNELEAIVAALVPIATGAGAGRLGAANLASWRRARLRGHGAGRRRRVRAGAVRRRRRRRDRDPGRSGGGGGRLPLGVPPQAAAVVAAPVVALAVLGGADLLLGGNAHLTRSVLEAGGLDQVADVAERRLRLSAGSFSRYAATPLLWICALVIVAGIVQRRRIEAWFGDRRTAWAGLGGAAAATVAGTLANDSGALVLMIGTALCALAAGLAWATQRPGAPPPQA